MRYGKMGLFHPLFVVQQNVQIDGTRPVLHGLHPSEIAFDQLQLD